MAGCDAQQAHQHCKVPTRRDSFPSGASHRRDREFGTHELVGNRKKGLITAIPIKCMLEGRLLKALIQL